MANENKTFKAWFEERFKGDNRRYKRTYTFADLEAGFEAGQKAEGSDLIYAIGKTAKRTQKETAKAIFKAVKLSAIRPAPDSIKAMTLNNEKVAIIYLDKLEAIEREYLSASDKKV